MVKSGKVIRRGTSLRGGTTKQTRRWVCLRVLRVSIVLFFIKIRAIRGGNYWFASLRSRWREAAVRLPVVARFRCASPPAKSLSSLRDFAKPCKGGRGLAVPWAAASGNSGKRRWKRNKKLPLGTEALIVVINYFAGNMAMQKWFCLCRVVQRIPDNSQLVP